MLLRKFESLLTEHLAETGTTGLVKAAFGILTAGGVLSMALGSVAVKAAGLAIAGLSTVAFLTLLLSSQRRLRRESDRNRALLDHHCELWYAQTEHRWRIDYWNEYAVIAPNGDADVAITVKALVEAQVLPFFRVRVGSGQHWSQPMSERRRVDLTVSSVEAGGAGPRWDATTRWMPDGRLEVLVHFIGASPMKGDELHLRFDFSWPGKAKPLMSGDSDLFTYRSGRPLALLRYRLRLPPHTQVRHTLVDLRPGIDDFEFIEPSDPMDPVVELVARDIAAGRRIGMRLGLK